MALTHLQQTDRLYYQAANNLMIDKEDINEKITSLKQQLTELEKKKEDINKNIYFKLQALNNVVAMETDKK